MRQRPQVVVGLPELDGVLEVPTCLGVLPEPVPSFPAPRQAARLANTPGGVRSTQREGALVAVDRLAALQAATGAVAGRGERVRRPLGQRPVARVQIEGCERRELQVVGREPLVAGLLQSVGHLHVEPEPFALRQVGVGDVAHGPVAEAPAGSGALLLDHEDLRLLEHAEIVAGRLGDHVDLVEVERVGEHGDPSRQVTRGGGQGIEASGDGGLHGGWERRARPAPIPVFVEQHPGGLDDEERVPARARRDGRRLGLGDPAPARLAHELDGVLR